MTHSPRFTGTSRYLTSESLRSAVDCALVLQRPLLVKGEPGTGKTLLAEAIAEGLGARLLTWNVKSTTRAQDGLYVYDTVQRLYDSRFGDGDVRDIKRYIRLGPLGQAFSAKERVVLLIDEVDKADLEFPNDLLHELDRMRFKILETDEEVVAQQRPVVVITSNNEKELPDAFLRRCVFHFIEFPDAELMRKIVDGPPPRPRRRARLAGDQGLLRAARLHPAAQAALDERAGRLARGAARARGAEPRPRAAPAVRRRAAQARAGSDRARRGLLGRPAHEGVARCSSGSSRRCGGARSRSGTHEAVALAGALSQGLHDSSLDGFYHVARALLVHSERHLDAFDQAFLEHFQGVEEAGLELTRELLDWLKDAQTAARAHRRGARAVRAALARASCSSCSRSGCASRRSATTAGASTSAPAASLRSATAARPAPASASAGRAATGAR